MSTRTHDVYLLVEYEDKDSAKAKGARWDAKARAWYVPAGLELEPFALWLKDEDLRTIEKPSDAIFSAEAARLDGICNFCSGTGRFVVRSIDHGPCFDCDGKGRLSAR